MDIEYVDAKVHYVNIDQLECGDVFVFENHERKEPCVYFEKRNDQHWFIALLSSVMSQTVITLDGLLFLNTLMNLLV